jgi:hypothetical protein
MKQAFQTKKNFTRQSKIILLLESKKFRLVLRRNFSTQRGDQTKFSSKCAEFTLCHSALQKISHHKKIKIKNATKPTLNSKTQISTNSRSMFIYRYVQTSQTNSSLQHLFTVRNHLLTYLFVFSFSIISVLLPMNIQFRSNAELQEGLKKVDSRAYERTKKHFLIGFSVSLNFAGMGYYA